MSPNAHNSIKPTLTTRESHPANDTQPPQLDRLSVINPSTRASIQRLAPYIIATSALFGAACEQSEIDTNESYCLQNGCDAGTDGATGGSGGILNVDGSAGTNNSGNLDGGTSANGGSGGSGNLDGSAANGGSGGTNTPDANTGGTSGTHNPDSGILDATTDSPSNPNLDSGQTQCGPYETPCNTKCCKSYQFCTPANTCNDCPSHTSTCGTGTCINLDYSDEHCSGCGNTCNSWENCWEGECQ